MSHVLDLDNILFILIGDYQCNNDELNCQNDGICRKSKGGAPYCDCPISYEGKKCEFSKGKLTT